MLLDTNAISALAAGDETLIKAIEAGQRPIAMDNLDDPLFDEF